MSNKTAEQAQLISDRVGFSVGIGEEEILAIALKLIPLLVQCFQSFKSPSAVGDSAGYDAHQYLLDHWDANTQTFDAELIDRCRPRTRRAARQSGHVRLSRDQLDVITVASLNQAKDAPPEHVGFVLSECESTAESGSSDESDDDGSNPPVVL